MNRCVFRIVFVLFAALVCGTASGADLLSRLKEDTASVVYVPNAQSIRTRFSDTDFGKVLNSESLAGLRAEWKSLTRDPDTIRQIGIRVSDLEELATGGLVVARHLDGHATLLVETEPQRAKRTMEHVEPLLLKFGAKKHTIPVPDGFLYAYSCRDPDWTRVYGYREGLFGLSSIQAGLDPLWKPLPRSLLQQPSWSAIQRNTATVDAPETDFVIHWYVAPWAALRQTMATSAGDSAQRKRMERLFEQGFDGVRAVGGRIALELDRSTYATFAVVDGPLKKTASALAFVPGEIPKIPDWMPSSPHGLAATRLDYNTVLAGYAHWFDAEHGGGDEGLFEMVLDDIRDEPDAPGVDIRKDVVQQLAGPLFSVTVATAGEARENATVFAVKVRDPQVVADAVARLLQGDPDVAKVEIGGHTGWKFGDLSRGGTRQILGPDLSGVTVCVAEGYAFASATEAAMRIVLSRRAESSEGIPLQNRIEDMVEELGGKAPFAFRDVVESDFLEVLLYGLLGDDQDEKSGIFDGVLRQSLRSKLTDEMLNRLRGALPPSPALKRLGPGFSVGESLKDGWLWRGVTSGKH